MGELWPHTFGEVSFYAACLCGAIAMLLFVATDDHWPFLFFAAGGMLMLVRSWLMLSNYQGTLDHLAEQELRTRRPRFGAGIENRFGAMILGLMGFGWLVGGLAGGLG